MAMAQPTDRVETANAPEQPFVEVRGLTRYFDVSKPWLNRVIEGGERTFVRAVDDVSFTISKGETLALVGESGCGKSTVARLIAGLMPPTSGSVLFDGTDLATVTNAADMRTVRKRFQMIFQDPYASLNPRWRVDQIIAEPIKTFGLATDKQEIEDQVADLLRLVKLDPADMRKYPHEFSGGQRQRICIARALSNKPEFIICDEPTSALDVSVQAQILNLMRDLQDEFGLTYLFISHNLAVVRHMATRIGVMYLGRIAEIAPSRDLFLSPQHPYTQMLIDAVPDLDMTGRERKAVEGEIPNPINPPSGCTFHPRCPLIMDRCKAERPLLRSTKTGQAACFALDD